MGRLAALGPRYAARAEGSPGADGISITACLRLAQVAHRNEDSPDMVRINFFRADRAAESPASFPGPSGHSSMA
jgi:hypothetical protein